MLVGKKTVGVDSEVWVGVRVVDRRGGVFQAQRSWRRCTGLRPKSVWEQKAVFGGHCRRWCWLGRVRWRKLIAWVEWVAVVGSGGRRVLLLSEQRRAVLDLGFRELWWQWELVKTTGRNLFRRLLECPRTGYWACIRSAEQTGKKDSGCCLLLE